MASSQITMRRYLVDRKQKLVINLAICVEQFIKRYGCPPTLAHVSMMLRDVPERIGPVRIERAWGVLPGEIDLGMEPVADPASSQSTVLAKVEA